MPGGSPQYTLIAEQLPEAARTAGNAVLSGFTMAALIIGPLLAGLAVTAAGPALAIAATPPPSPDWPSQPQHRPDSSSRAEAGYPGNRNRRRPAAEPGVRVRRDRQQPRTSRAARADSCPLLPVRAGR